MKIRYFTGGKDGKQPNGVFLSFDDDPLNVLVTVGVPEYSNTLSKVSFHTKLLI